MVTVDVVNGIWKINEQPYIPSQVEMRFNYDQQGVEFYKSAYRGTATPEPILVPTVTVFANIINPETGEAFESFEDMVNYFESAFYEAARTNTGGGGGGGSIIDVIQFRVGTGGAPANGSTEFTDSRLDDIPKAQIALNISPDRGFTDAFDKVTSEDKITLTGGFQFNTDQYVLIIVKAA